MSHVAKVDVEITNLDDLDGACKRIGLELVRGQQEYRWYGKSVGDYPLPAGFTEADLGKCDHAIRVPESEAERLRSIYGDRPYEIGVVARRDGKQGWSLMWDFFADGFGLTDFVGTSRDANGEETGQLPKLKQAYAIAAASRVARQQGFRIQERAGLSGGIELFLTK